MGRQYVGPYGMPWWAHYTGRPTQDVGVLVAAARVRDAMHGYFQYVGQPPASVPEQAWLDRVQSRIVVWDGSESDFRGVPKDV